MGLSFPEDKINFNSVEVSWEAPERPNGKIGYFLSYWKSSIDPSSAKTLVLSGEVRSRLVPNLKPFTNYTFSVEPYNLRKNLTGGGTRSKVQTKATSKNFSCLIFLVLNDCLSVYLFV